jgi:hypothetical protein
LGLFKVLVLDLLEDSKAVGVDSDREGCQSRGQLFILYVSGVDRSILETVPPHQGSVMYVDESIDGGIAHIWARDVITAMGMEMLERIALGS